MYLNRLHLGARISSGNFWIAAAHTRHPRPKGFVLSGCACKKGSRLRYAERWRIQAHRCVGQLCAVKPANVHALMCSGVGERTRRSCERLFSALGTASSTWSFPTSLLLSPLRPDSTGACDAATLFPACAATRNQMLAMIHATQGEERAYMTPMQKMGFRKCVSSIY